MANDDSCRSSSRTLSCCRDVLLPMAVDVGGRWTLTHTVPNSPALLGVVYYHQGAVTEPSNLSGFASTPALRMMVGER